MYKHPPIGGVIYLYLITHLLGQNKETFTAYRFFNNFFAIFSVKKGRF